MSWCDWRDVKLIPKIGLLLIERSLVMQMNRFLGLSSFVKRPLSSKPFVIALQMRR